MANRSKVLTSVLIAGAASLVPIVAIVVWGSGSKPETTKPRATTSGKALSEETSPSPTSTPTTKPPPARTTPFVPPMATATSMEPPAVAVAPDPSAAEEFDPKQNTFIQKCEHQDEAACEVAGQAYRWGRNGFPRSPEKAREYFQRGCDLDSAMSCLQLAFMVKNGRGGQPDEGTAERLFTRTFELNEEHCEEGDTVACVRMADAYRHGRGVEKDVEKADEVMKTLKPGLEDYRDKLEERKAPTP